MKKHLPLGLVIGALLAFAGVAWASTVVPVNQGGTGIAYPATGYKAGSVLYGNGTSAIATSSALTFSGILFTATNASTTQLSAAAQKFYVNSSGKMDGYDVTNTWSGQMTPTRVWTMNAGTTTAWLATTSIPYSPIINGFPFSGTIENAVCSTDASYVNGAVLINGAKSAFITGINSKPATTTLSLAIGAGAKLQMDFGTSTGKTPTTKLATCTFSAIQTP